MLIELSYIADNLKFSASPVYSFLLRDSLHILHRGDSGKSGNKYLSDLAGKGSYYLRLSLGWNLYDYT